VNREAEQIYENLYEETLANDPGAGGARVAQDTGAAQTEDEPPEKGKRHG
jgi:hypothetical protein